MVVIILSWDDDKTITGATVSGSDWNTMVTEIKTVKVATNTKVILDGTGDTYIIFNGTKVAIYVNNVKKAEWG